MLNTDSVTESMNTCLLSPCLMMSVLLTTILFNYFFRKVTYRSSTISPQFSVCIVMAIKYFYIVLTKIKRQIFIEYEISLYLNDRFFIMAYPNI